MAMTLGLVARIALASAVFVAFGSSYGARRDCGPAIGLIFTRRQPPDGFRVSRCSDYSDDARRLAALAGGFAASALGLFGGAWVVVRRRPAGGPGGDAPQVSLA